MFRKFLGLTITFLVCGAVLLTANAEKIALSDEEMAITVDQKRVLSLLQEQGLHFVCEHIRKIIQGHDYILPDQKYEVERIGDNLLCLAAFLGHVDVVKYLLEQGVAADSCTYFGTTPLMYAIVRGNVAIAQLLLAYGAQMSTVNRYGESVQELLKGCRAENMQVLCDMYSI